MMSGCNLRSEQDHLEQNAPKELGRRTGAQVRIVNATVLNHIAVHSRRIGCLDSITVIFRPRCSHVGVKT